MIYMYKNVSVLTNNHFFINYMIVLIFKNKTSIFSNYYYNNINSSYSFLRLVLLLILIL